MLTDNKEKDKIGDTKIKEVNAKLEKLKQEEERLKNERERLKKEGVRCQFSQVISDKPISWTSTPRIMRKHTQKLTYITLNPDSFENPLNVRAPQTHSGITIVLEDVYAEYSGKVRVTIEPLKKGGKGGKMLSDNEEKDKKHLRFRN